MNVKNLTEALKLRNLTGKGEEKNVTGVYVCDLLSRVMSSCGEGDVWITVQTHLNTLAVAELNDAACIVIPEAIEVEETTVERAGEKEIALLSSELSAYELCWQIHCMLDKDEI